ncbi:uncharacterized protein LOC111854839 isoform X1 [Arapaima gigas]
MVIRKRCQFTMSQTCDTALSARKNTLQIFSKHFNMQAEANSSSVQTVPNAADPNHDIKADKRLKVKRLKTRKERRLMTRLRAHEGGPYSLHQSKREGKYLKCCSCRDPLQPLYKSAMPVHTSSGVEPCITDSRLIGHRGLFNREVKSIDIERLIDQCKKKPVQMVGGHSNDAGLSTHCLSPVPEPSARVATSSVKQTKEQKHRKPGQTQNNTKMPQAKACKCRSDDSTGRVLKNAVKESTALEVGLGNGKEAGGCSPPGDSKSQRPSTTSGEKEVKLKILSRQSFTYKRIPQSTSDGCSGATGNEKLRFPPVELGHDSLPLHGARKEGAQGRDTKDKTVISSTLQHVLQIPSAATQSKQPLEAGLYLLEINQLKSSVSSDSLDEVPTQKPEDIAPANLDAVALRLCRSLEMPLSHRRDLLSENREALLRVLQERHGVQLQENLFGLCQRLCCSAGVAEKVCGPYETCRDDICMAAPTSTNSYPESSHIQTFFHGPTDPHLEEFWPSTVMPETPVKHRKQPHLPMPDLQKRQEIEFLPQFSLREFQTRRRKGPQPCLHVPDPKTRQRKQAHPQKEAPYVFTNVSQADDTWNSSSSPFVKLARDNPEKLFGSYSPEFLMDFQPIFPLSPKRCVDGTHTGARLHLDQKPKRGAVRAAAGMEDVWYCRDARFSPTETRHETMDRSRGTKHWPQWPSLSRWSHFSPLQHSRSAPCLHSACIPDINVSVPKLNGSHNVYPPSAWLMRSYHPPQPFCYPSPDHWFFPRMRLY